ISLLKGLRKIKGIKKIFISSGIRYDLLLSDKAYGEQYLREVVGHHVSGQMKVAPEHTEENVLRMMGKVGTESLIELVRLFNNFSRAAGKKQYLTYYFIAAHPGCDEGDMKGLKSFISRNLKTNPEQVQIFTPTPSTYSTLMYYTELDPFTKEKIYVEKDVIAKERQKNIVTSKWSARTVRTFKAG
ncbi:DUF3362 domain-containing protein, partial [bacterium]|nr:DUF3362 domain-containing protein [bacterium]